MLAIRAYSDIPVLYIPWFPLESRGVCYFLVHRAVELGYPAISILYGMKPSAAFPPTGDIFSHYPTDLLAFVLIIYMALGSGMYQFKMPSLFRIIAQDATYYFLVIFSSHLTLELTLIFGRVRIISSLYFPLAYRNLYSLQFNDSPPCK